MNRPRPFVFLNLAMTADGKIASANRAVSSFGSARDQAHMYELRATADAVMCGARTADLNAIQLGPGDEKYRAQRRRRGLPEFNLRVIASGTGSIDPEAEIFKHRFSPIIILTTRRIRPASLKRLRGLADAVLVCGAREIAFGPALRRLREQWNVERLLCEGGGELNDALFRGGLVDELHLTICPNVFGGRQAATISDGIGFRTLMGTARLRLNSLRRMGNELFLVFGTPQGRGRNRRRTN